jgi:type III restriction enzyme
VHQIARAMEPTLITPARRLWETPRFSWSRQTVEARTTVFNLAACENNVERDLARFIENTPDVDRFAKLPSLFNFTIEYTDAAGNLRYYEPDFVAVDTSGEHFLIETKGREDIDVAGKDRAARLWCDNAIRLTGTPWNYIKVPRQNTHASSPHSSPTSASSSKPVSPPASQPPVAPLS